MEGAFQHRLGIDLEEALHKRSFRWFLTRLAYLLNDPENLLYRRFVKPPEPPEPPSLNL